MKEPFLPLRYFFLTREFADNQDIKTCCALQRRAARNFKKTGAIPSRKFAISFSNMERDAG